MELFPITLPKQNICNETELYYRSTKPVQYNETAGTIIMPKKAVLTLDTYFNCFSYSKYQQYTYASVVEVHVQVQGEVQLRLLKAELNGKKIQRTVLLTQNINYNQLNEAVLRYDFSKETGNGFFYLEVTALSKNAVFAGGFYASPLTTEQQNRTKLAAVICTYKREDYVKRNLKHLNDALFAYNNEIAEQLEIFVIDNGQTLTREEVENKYISLYPNKNYGGSGGFTRGIIEALKRKSEFSHVLLMDDDILLESNVLVKTIRFLQIVREEHQDLAIGGSMLRLDTMNIQHCLGDCWDGRKIINVKRDYPLEKVEYLLKNEMETKADYNAWWYCCMPLCEIGENNLPLPLFVREDDVEYGLRLFEKWLHTNGIGVWHPPFTKKDNPVMEYYNTRNQLITNAIHYPENPLYKDLYILARFAGKCLLKGNAHMVAIPFRGFLDYSKGIEWLQKQESDKLHQQLIAYKNKLEEHKRPAVYYWLYAAVSFLRSSVYLLLKRKWVVNGYQQSLENITSRKFWTQKLGID